MKKYLFIFAAVIFAFFAFNAEAGTHVSKYNKTLSRSEKEAICKQLQGAPKQTPRERNGLGGGVVPDEVLTSIYNTTRNISNSVMLVSILGDTLMCHSVHAAKKNVEVWGIHLGSYPNIPIWLCGAVIYFFGFMLLLSITFYVVDISFKLGFAIILMPIGIALWPFDKTKDKIVILISIFLKSAAILAFLSITVAYTVGMLSESLSGLREVFEAIATNNTDYISETFTLEAKTFLIVVAALAYGMKLIGSTIPQYVNKFFPDKAFGDASPMHHLSTQAMDFAKQKVVAPVATYAGNVAETQIGKGVEKVGRFARGGYHEQIKSGIQKVGVAIRNPKQTIEKAELAIAHGETKVITGAMKKFNNLKYGAQIAASGLVAGKDNRDALRDKLRNARDEENKFIDDQVAENYENQLGEINQAINRREQLRADDKQREHEEKMNNDPVYKAKFTKKQEKEEERAKEKKERHDQRYAKIDTYNKHMEDIDKAKESRKADISRTFGKIDNFFDKIKQGKGSARVLHSLQEKKRKTFDAIDTGKFGEKDEDGWFKTGYKAAVRGVAKGAVSLGMGVAQAPFGIVSGTVNMGLNTISTGAKLISGAAMGSYNGVINGIYSVKKIPTAVKRAFKKAPEALGDIARAPGNIIEKTGQAMQEHKKK